MFEFLSIWSAVRRRVLQRVYRKNYMRRWYKENADSVNARRRASEYTPPNKKRSSKSWNDKHPGYYRKYALKNKYGLTLEAWNQLFDAQDRCCAICKRDRPGARNWHTDHDHDTGRVRGILCQRCNHGIAWLGDNAAKARAVAAAILTYLQEDV